MKLSSSLSLLLLLICSLCSCTAPSPVNTNFFQEFTQVAAEKSEFWDREIPTNIFLVNPADRSFETSEGEVGILEPTVPIANTRFEWKGASYFMLIKPLHEDRRERLRLAFHESFHVMQDSLGLASVEAPNLHLDSYEGRVAMALEMKALEKALTESTRAEGYMRTALDYRLARQAEASVRYSEQRLELNEGLAEYTGVMLCESDGQQRRDMLLKSLRIGQQQKSWNRNFAYYTFPIYACHLAEKNPGWHRNLTSESDVSDFFSKHISAKPFALSAEEILALQEAQQHITDSIQEMKQTYISLLLEDEPLIMDLKRPNISFDPNKTLALEEGTVYFSLFVEDEWGRAEVEKAALVSSDWKKLYLPKAQEVGDTLILGEGYRIIR